ncbi:MAG: hypothetical protein GXP27_20880 [Planctomycetes bacterium]|nr:hypothetical protein [Planctomycetota bacterium]
MEVNVLDADRWPEFLAMMRVGFADAFSSTVLASGSAAAPASKSQPVAKATKPVAKEGAADPVTAWKRLVEQIVSKNQTVCFFAPRGIGLTAWNPSERKQTHIRRRFMLLGQTLDGMRVWDVRRGLQVIRGLPGLKGRPIHLRASGVMAGIVLYASLFEPPVERLDLTALPASHRDGPIFLNVLRFLDIPQAVAMAADRANVCLIEPAGADAGDPWQFPRTVATSLGWPTQRLNFARPPQ